MLGFRTKSQKLSQTIQQSRIRSWSDLRDTLAAPLVLPSTVQLHLLRHGETVTNAQSVVTGSQDVALSPNGEEQARQAGRELDSSYDLAMHSTLSRSHRTLVLALQAGHTKVTTVRADARLNERSLGVLELKPSKHVDEFARGDMNYAPEGGENYAEVTRRSLSLLLDLRAFVIATQSDKILLCGHMGPMRILLGILEDLSDPVQVLAQSFTNTQIIRIQWRQLTFPRFLPASL
jgi:probable phosphoglycerate mutase